MTNLTVFAALLKDVPVGCKNAILPEPLLKNRTVNCLAYEENTRQPYNDNLCLFRALALRLHGTQRLEEETSKIFILFINKTYGLSPNQFVDVVDGNIVGELARRSVQKYENTVRLLRYNNHICYVDKINAVFQFFRCPNRDTFF